MRVYTAYYHNGEGVQNCPPRFRSITRHGKKYVAVGFDTAPANTRSRYATVEIGSDDIPHLVRKIYGGDDHDGMLMFMLTLIEAMPDEELRALRQCILSILDNRHKQLALKETTDD